MKWIVGEYYVESHPLGGLACRPTPNPERLQVGVDQGRFPMLDTKIILALALLMGTALGPLKPGPTKPAGGIPPPKHTTGAGSFQ